MRILFLLSLLLSFASTAQQVWHPSIEVLKSGGSWPQVRASDGWQVSVSGQNLLSAQWLRFKIPPQPEANEPLYVYLPKVGMLDAALYLPSYQQGIQLKLNQPTGHALSPQHFTLQLPAASTGQYVYLQLNKGRWQSQISVGTALGLAEHDYWLRSFWPFSFGILCFGLLFAAVMWSHFRQPVYLAYGCYVIASVLFFVERTGPLYLSTVGQWLAATYQYNVAGMALCLLFASGLLFTMTMAESRLYAPRWYKFGLVLTALLALQMLLRLIGVDMRVQVHLTNLLYLLTTITAFAICIVSSIAGSRYAMFALAGQSILLPVSAAMLLNSLGLPLRLNAEYFWLPLGYAVEILVFAAGLADRALNYKQERDVAWQLANSDKLTECLNRRAWEEREQQLDKMGSNDRSQYYLAVLDIDHFKTINDNYGHHVGDQCLKLFCQTVRLSIRQQDQLYRFGGEEFVLLLDSGNLQLAQEICERIRQQTEQLCVVSGDQQIRFTVSVGLTGMQQFQLTGLALVCADQALYRAKAEGRNRLAIAV